VSSIYHQNIAFDRRGKEEQQLYRYRELYQSCYSTFKASPIHSNK
jgi:hypothetical protein